MTAANNRRATARRRVCLGAKIQVDAASEPVDVWVRSLSEAGASVRIPDECLVPNPFQLSLNHAGMLGAQIVWKKGRDVGVLFDKALTGAPRAVDSRSWIGEVRRTLTFTARV
jgi:hypothetical protein